jgi:hypothetical protein
MRCSTWTQQRCVSSSTKSGTHMQEFYANLSQVLDISGFRYQG